MIEQAAGTLYYEVSVEVAERVAPEFVEYMMSRHVHEVFATGCFVNASFATAGEGHFRTVYEAAGREDLDRYLRDHADALRRDFLDRFPHSVVVSRQVWVELGRIAPAR
jgi:hypothetical protein